MLPLENIKVLDLGRTLPGPYCAMILGDMGADVIRIEEPGRLPPPYLTPEYIAKIDPEKREEILAVYNFMHRNKNSLCLNLKNERAKEVFYKLAKDSDVVIEDLRPNVTKRLNIDFETLKALNPRIIYCAITGYGQDGPYRDRPGHDPNYMGVGGVLGLTGTPDGRYVIPGVPFADLAAGGMQGAIGILCALMARSKTGKGQFVDIAMTDTVASWMALRHGQLYFSTGKQPKLGERIPHVYETMDGKHICLSPGEPHFWERLCSVLGLEEYITYREDVLLFGPSGKGLEITKKMDKVFRTKTRDQWLELLADTGVSPVYGSMEEVYADPQILHRDMLLEMDHSTLGKVRQIGIPVKLSDTPGEVRMLPRKTGQDTHEILTGLGYNNTEIESLRKSGVIN
ncbi:CaiB/BaiF CoA transferase family protein [Thermodesulfobacteriota bacterium]